jgi:hypothetical protein
MKVALKAADKTAPPSTNAPNRSAVVLQRVPSAQIKSEEPCNVSGALGQKVNFEFNTSQGRYFGSVNFFDYPGCDLEVSTVAPVSEFNKAYCQFNGFVNSLHVATVVPPKEVQ